jgi:signal transduction histidine kinase
MEPVQTKPQHLEKSLTPSSKFVRDAKVGLGLAISKAIVKLHGGSIRAESAGLEQGRAIRDRSRDHRSLRVAVVYARSGPCLYFRTGMVTKQFRRQRFG